MIKEICLPEISEGVVDAEVLQVLVAVGDSIEIDQAVIELETDKATFEVPSTVAGKVVEIKAQKGQKVCVGQLLLKIESETKVELATEQISGVETGKSVPQQAEKTADAVNAAPLARSLARQLEIDIKDIKGTGEYGRILAEDVKEYAKNPKS